MTAPCPCGSGQPYETCCGPLHAGRKQALTAEALMRSRYAAFVKNDMDYLERTLDPRKRGRFTPGEIAAWNADVAWKGLRVLSLVDGGEKDASGLVEFEAAFEKAGVPGLLRERSRFRKKAGAWFYVDGLQGEALAAASGVAAPAPGVGRNAPCPCGSGKKYKRCCGA